MPQEKNTSTIDLQKDVEQQKRALAKLRMSHALEPLKDPSLLRKKRREIARVLTKMNQQTNEINSNG